MKCPKHGCDLSESGDEMICLACKAEAAEYQRRYYEGHKAEAAEYQRRYREGHKAEVAEQQRRRLAIIAEEYLSEVMAS